MIPYFRKLDSPIKFVIALTLMRKLLSHRTIKKGKFQGPNDSDWQVFQLCSFDLYAEHTRVFLFYGSCLVSVVKAWLGAFNELCLHIFLNHSEFSDNTVYRVYCFICRHIYEFLWRLFVAVAVEGMSTAFITINSVAFLPEPQTHSSHLYDSVSLF